MEFGNVMPRSIEDDSSTKGKEEEMEMARQSIRYKKE